MYDSIQLLRNPRVRAWLALVLAALIILAIGVEFLGPIDPYHRAVAQELRGQFDAIPPYPDSTITTYKLKAGLFDQISTIAVGYASSVSCTTVQDYYRVTLDAHSWVAEGTPQVLHTDQNPSHDQIETLYGKAAQNFPLQWSVSCFVDNSFQSGYSIIISSPPLQ